MAIEPLAGAQALQLGELCGVVASGEVAGAELQVAPGCREERRERFHSRICPGPLEPGDGRLRRAGACGQLGLGEAGLQAGAAEERAGSHG